MKTFPTLAVKILLFGLLAVPVLAQSSSTPGTISTYAGVSLPANGTSAVTQPTDAPTAVVPDPSGGFYFASPVHQRVYHVSANGTLAVVAGTGTTGFSGDGGPATAARLSSPFGIALDAAGNLYIADYDNGRVRKVTPNGVITTVAGNGTFSFSGDGGPATAAGIGPVSVAVDAAGNIIIADYDNERIRKVTPNGVIATVAGTGTPGFSGDGGLATSAELANPSAVAVDSAGNIYVADHANYRIRKVLTDGRITTIAGNGDPAFGGDGDSAMLAGVSPSSIAVDSAGSVYIADLDNDRVRKVTSEVITTVAGNGTTGFSGDGGAATSAQIALPFGVGVDTAGNLFIADFGNQRIRKVLTTGQITTVAGNGIPLDLQDGVPATGSRLLAPTGLVMDGAGNLFIADSVSQRIRKVSPSGTITTVAGTGTPGFTGDGGQATSARLANPTGVAADAAGNLYIADYDNGRIRKIEPNGVITTVAGNGSFIFNGDGVPALSAGINPTAVAVDAAGNIYIADFDSDRVRKVTTDGRITTVAGNGTAGFSGDGGPATSASVDGVISIALDAAGNLYLAEYINNRIRKVTPGGVITTVAGNGDYIYNGDGGAATSAALGPTGVLADAAGNLFIVDTDNGRIRKVATNGTISTIAGGGDESAVDDGVPATSAFLSFPRAIALDATGNLLIADAGDSRIRKVSLSQQLLFSMIDRGGVSLRTSGAQGSTRVGYASIQPAASSATPAGLAIFGYRQNNILVTEAGVPASPLIRSGRTYAEVGLRVNTGLAIANPNDEPATISFYFSNNGGNFGSGTTTIPAHGQMANFLNEPPFNGPASVSGTFTFSSTVPVSVIALRGLSNERSEFLITTLPVANLDVAAASNTVVFPHFADGGGWTSQIILVNPTDGGVVGSIQFLDAAGRAATVVVNNQQGSQFTYAIPPRASLKVQTAGLAASTVSGSVRVVPANSPAPLGLAVFSFRKNGITVSEAGVPALEAGSAFRLYAESSTSIQTGLAITNTSANTATVTLELSRLDGASTGLTGTISIPANGQVATFLNEVQGFGSLPAPFQGVLRVSSISTIAVTGLRGRYNERNDFLITTTPPVNEAAPPATSALFFPHIADSGGYTTQFILFSARPGATSSGTIELFSQNGGALSVVLQ